jgi:hypothetical protein
MNVLSDWASAVSSELGVRTAPLDRELLIDLTRSVRRCVASDAVGETMYLLGISVGQGASPAEAARRIEELAGHWRGVDWSD